LRSHRVLFTAINNVYHVTGVHEMEDLGVFSPSRAYARTAIEHFGGSVSAERAAGFGEAFGLFQELVGTREPLALLRLRALFNLVLTEDEPTRRERWIELAGFAAEIMTRTVRRGVFQPLNNCLDIPFAYLDAPIPEGTEDLEGQRSLLRFDPFDQDLAMRELDDAWERLGSLWERMRDVAPGYAAERLEPFASEEEFERALGPGR